MSDIEFMRFDYINDGNLVGYASVVVDKKNFYVFKVLRSKADQSKIFVAIPSYFHKEKWHPLFGFDSTSDFKKMVELCKDETIAYLKKNNLTSSAEEPKKAEDRGNNNFFDKQSRFF